jgi:hypothetical protein
MKTPNISQNWEPGAEEAFRRFPQGKNKGQASEMSLKKADTKLSWHTHSTEPSLQAMLGLRVKEQAYPTRPTAQSHSRQPHPPASSGASQSGGEDPAVDEPMRA